MGRQRISTGILVVWAALLLCLGLAVFQNFQLRKKVEGLRQQVSRTFEAQLGPVPGDLTVLDGNGNATTLPLGELEAPPTVIFAATSTCPFCRENMTRWRDLVDRLGTSVRFLPLRLDSPSSSGAVRPFPDPFPPPDFTFPGRPDLEWLSPSDASVVDYRFRFVPQTLVIRGGELIFVETGPLSDEQLGAIEAAVAPGASAAPGASDPV